MSDKKVILLVDDDVDFIDGNKDLLEAEGFEIICAFDGEEALSAVQIRKPDLIVLDVMMKTETEGMEVSRRLGEDPDFSDIPVILLTGIRRAMNLPFMFEPDGKYLPVKAVLEKPVQPLKLITEIRKWIE